MLRALKVTSAILCAVCLAAVVVGCAPVAGSKGRIAGVDDPRIPQDVRDAVLNYDVLIAEGYATMNMNKMVSVAATEQAEKEYYHMASLAEGGIRMVPMLKEIIFTTMSVDPSGNVTVQSLETWDYQHYSRATSEVVRTESDVQYLLGWILAKRPTGAYFVKSVRAIETTGGGDAGFGPSPESNRKRSRTATSAPGGK
jgi:hypothetical protein